MYNESKLRRKAKKAGYTIHKGYQRSISHDHAVCVNFRGECETGYNLIDNVTGFLVCGCFDQSRDHLFTLEDVQDFLASVYYENAMNF